MLPIINWDSPLLPLTAATVLLIGIIIDAPRDSGRPLWRRLVIRAVAFAVLTWLLRRAIGSPVTPAPLLSSEGKIWSDIVQIGWWAVGARVAVGVLRLLVVLEGQPRETQIISDLLAGAIYTTTALAVVNFVFGVPIGSLIATSGVVAIVLGLALQSTLADVFSGIAMGLEHAYKPGDMLWVEGGVEGQVIQMSWRSTQIATYHSSVAVVPNSVIAKARLENRSAPTPVRTVSLTISVDAGVDPRRCIAALTAAAEACRMPLPSPKPVVVCTALRGDGNSFEVRFTVGVSRDIEPARTEALSLIHRHLRYAGIGLGIEGVTPLPPAKPPTLTEIVAESELLGQLPAEERQALIEHFVVRRFEAGEALIRQNDTPTVLCLITEGAVELTREDTGETRVLRRSNPGDSVSGIALIARMASPYTATALTPVSAYCLEAEALAAALRAQPAIASSLEAQIHRGSAWLHCEAEVHEEALVHTPEMLLERLRQFLETVDD